MEIKQINFKDYCSWPFCRDLATHLLTVLGESSIEYALCSDHIKQAKKETWQLTCLKKI